MTTETEEDIYYPEMDYYLNESLSDVLFVIEGHRLPAIKHILSFKSRVFREMFSENLYKTNELQESKLPEIEIEDTTADAFQTLIRFIYTELLVFNDDKDLLQICEVYRLSERFEVLRLRQSIGNYFESLLNTRDVLLMSRVVSALNVEPLMEMIVTFIEENINDLVLKDIEELRELNDLTNDKLLDVLTSGRPKSDNLVRFVVGLNQRIYIKKEVILNKIPKEVLVPEIPVHEITKEISFDAIKRFVGYLYFDKLKLKDNEDFQLIREVCELSKRYKQKIILDTIGDHLLNRITIETLEPISRIAYFYRIDGLIKRVNDFTKENFTEIMAKSNKLLFKINEYTNNSLLEVLTDFYRKSVEENNNNI